MKYYFLPLAFSAVLLAGCKEEKVEVPEPSDEHCTLEFIKSIENKDAQQELSSLCLRRDTDAYKDSPDREW